MSRDLAGGFSTRILSLLQVTVKKGNGHDRSKRKTSSFIRHQGYRAAAPGELSRRREGHAVTAGKPGL